MGVAGSRTRWVLAFTVVLLISAAVPVFANSPDSAQEGSIPQAPAGDDPERYFDGHVVPVDLGAVEREEREREEWLASPEAVQQREASWGAFGDFSPEESEDLLRAVFSEQLAALSDDPARFISDAQLIRPQDETSAAVSDEGERSLLDATIPLRTEDENGDLAKLDLSLTRTAQGYETVNAISDLLLPLAGDEKAEVGDRGLAISQAGAQDSSARRFGDKNLLYPDVLPDTDLMIAPIGTGVEFFNLLRSKESPEELRFEIELPPGAVLRATEYGGAEVVRDDETLNRIAPPIATDAQGTNVPVELTVEQSAIVLHVNHREGDFAAPILVDPIVEDWANTGNNWYEGKNLAALTNGAWKYASNNSSIGHNTCCYEGHNGLLTYTEKNVFYGSEQYGQWSYSTPNYAAFVTEGWVVPFWRNVGSCGSSVQPHDYAGILWEPGKVWNPVVPNEAQNGEVHVHGKGHAFIIGLGSGPPGVWISCARYLYAGGVALWLDDDWGPAISVSGIPTGWASDLKPITLTVKANDNGMSVDDDGLGIDYITINPDGASVLKDDPGCSGLYGSTCPTVRTWQKTFTGDSMREGIRDLGITAADPTGKVVEQHYTTMVDRSVPEVALSGQLAKATGEVVSYGEVEPPVSQGEDKLSLPVYKLEIEARDGDKKENKTKQSGVKDIRVFLDGDEMEVPWEPLSSCPLTSCEMDVTYSLPLSEIETAGNHKLEVKVEDFVGKVIPRNIEFEYFPATGMKDEYVMHYFPLPDGQGNEAEEEHPSRPELAVNVMNGNLVYRERDVDVESTAAVDLEVERFYNSMLPDSENTEWGDGWTLAQTPDLEPVDTGGSPAPDEAELLDTSGAIEDEVALPTEAGAQKFDPTLQATLTKKSSGGYELSDETGESATSVAFDETGQTEARLTEGDAKVDYDYEGGHLAEIAVEDPGSTEALADEIEEPAPTPNAPYTDVLYADSFGSGGSGDGKLQSPADVAIDAAGNLWVLDRGNNRVQKFNSEGEFLAKFGSYGSGNGQFNSPSAIALDSEGNLFITDSGNNRVQKFNSKGEYLSQFGSYGTGNGQFKGPSGIAISPGGPIFVADRGNHRIERFTKTGAYFGQNGSYGWEDLQFDEPTALAIGPPSGEATYTVYVTDSGNNRIKWATPAGVLLGKLGTYGSGNGQFNSPGAIDVDAKGNVWVGDRNNSRVQLFDSTGKYVDQFGTAGSGEGQFGLAYPMGIATDGAGGVWVSDANNARLQKWVAGSFVPDEEQELAPDDPAVQVEVTGGLIASLEGEQAGTHDYAHTGQLLSAHDGPEGETKYTYDSGRMTEVTLANGTWGQIVYYSDGRVKSVTVDPAGSDPAKTTYFEYKDDPRSTTVEPPGEPHITYDIGADGSVLKWWNTKKPPYLDLAGTLYDERNKPGGLSPGDHWLKAEAISTAGIASIQVLANGTDLVDEITCNQDHEKPGIECEKEINEWVTSTELHAPGHLNLEVIATDSTGESASERFWVDIPQPPPPPALGTPVPPKYHDIAKFREEYGLEVVFPVANETELNERIFNLIKAWYEPGTPTGQVARASMDRWGVPLRPVDLAELEYREWYVQRNAELLEDWAGSNAVNTYAGYYVDHPTGGKFYIGFTNSQAEHISQLEDAVSLEATERIFPYPTTPTHPYSTLKSLQMLVGAATASQPLRGLVSEVGLDAKANAVTVGATDVNQATSILTQTYGQHAGISVHFQPQPEFASRYTDEGPIRAGHVIGWWSQASGKPATCTAGFGAAEQLGKLQSGKQKVAHFVLTAGHCFPENFVVRRFHSNKDDHPDRIGVVTRRSFEKAQAGFKTDAEAVELEASGLVPQTIYRSDIESPAQVTGTARAYPGMSVCTLGASSNTVRCGEITEINVSPPTAADPDFGPFWDLQFNKPVEYGDSGGPMWLAGSGKAVGLISTIFRQAAPMVQPRSFPDNPYDGYPPPDPAQMPGILNAPGMGKDLYLVEAR